MFGFVKTKRRKPASAGLPPAPGRTVYAVGDIHGRADLLQALLRQMEIDRARTNPDDPILVFLGDYIDRGDDSAQVLDVLHDLWIDASIETRFIMGNHEAAMISFLDDPVKNSGWLRIGGLQTLLSYKVGGISEHADAASVEKTRDSLARRLGRHGAFIRHALTLSTQIGNIFFCHAAVDRTLPLDRQQRETLLWGSPDFVSNGGPQDSWIVHGHTFSEEPYFGKNRIGLDTGAYFSGRLSAARISKSGVHFLSTGD